MTRRDWFSLAAAPLAPVSGNLRQRLIAWLETHRRAPGAYGWASDLTPHLSPTFAVVACYRLLDAKLPEPAQTAAFLREHYPVPDQRRKERPIWIFDWQQVQALQWLGEPVDSFRALAATWAKPSAFTKTYELGGNPILQYQSAAVRVRRALGLSPAAEDKPWHEYFLARRRPDGTFNTTPASDGSGGNLMNTLWGLLACEALGLTLPPAPGLADWVQSCQLSSGGHTYAPGATLGAVDDVAYSWCALQILDRLGVRPRNAAACGAWIDALLTPTGGYQDRPGGEPNPLATYYALDSLRLLGRTPRAAARPAPRARQYAIPAGARVFSAQIQAPGAGSPREAVALATALGIHLWTAKNAAPGWVAEARRIAAERRAPVEFHIANEEYGTYVTVPGLGCYSHLVDTLAPFGRDSGTQLEKKNHPYPWAEFRDTRNRALRAGGGRLIWQFQEGEEITRVLLDEAAEQRTTYAGIAGFHFGWEDFLHMYPFLHRWYERLPFVALQDAHGAESWWWAERLAGFTNLFIAKENTWDAWLEALEKRHVMSVRHDAVTEWKTQLAGGSPAVREFILKREAEWRWWDAAGRVSRLPAALLTPLEAGARFEAGAPESGRALRLRLPHIIANTGAPKTPLAEPVSLKVDGAAVTPRLVEEKNDRYLIHHMPDVPGKHTAEAELRWPETGRKAMVAAAW